ncbi:MAG: ThuA domain-containing protein [Akkermansiaceae bacterium]|nr:ThuA domain-containing protein [Akkermansiaceae bacterium]
MKKALIITLLLGVALYPIHAAPIRVLMISGQNNHNWKVTTPVIKKFLEKSGTINVHVMENPSQLTQADFNGVDLIVSNWNSYSSKGEVPRKWPETTRNAYVEFVRNGGGHVGIHAGTSSFYDWKDYRAIGLMTWENGKTTHGAKHRFPLRIDNARHPVTRGWQPKAIHDELWRRPLVHPGAIILASSFSASSDGGSESWEPCVLVGRFGRGRCFTTSLGHDAQSLSQPDVQQIILRGVLWTAKVR